jgi:hypothetical protein
VTLATILIHGVPPVLAFIAGTVYRAHRPDADEVAHWRQLGYDKGFADGQQAGWKAGVDSTLDQFRQKHRNRGLKAHATKVTRKSASEHK